MITRGILTYSDSDELKVYIPILDGKIDLDSLMDKDLSKRYQGRTVSAIVGIPGLEYNFQPGDAVMVGFENQDPSSPIIIGYLQSAIKSNQKQTSLEVNNLKVNGKLEASTNVKFGDNLINFNDIFNKIEDLN